MPRSTMFTESIFLAASMGWRLIVAVRGAALSRWSTRRRRAGLEGLLLWWRVLALWLIRRILFGHHWYALALDCLLLLNSLVD